MTTIAFHSNQLGLRGTETALYDYARHNEELLLNRSVIVTAASSPMHHPLAVEKFKKRFQILTYNQPSQIDQLLEEAGCHALYCIKSGENDGILATELPTFVHCVFNTRSPHGTVYAAVSSYTSQTGGGTAPVVPHIVDLPHITAHVRRELAIPENATVFGRHGGRDTFDIPFVRKVVEQVAARSPNHYFLFLGTAPFCKRSNIIFLNETSDLSAKARFINSCDAMLHARMSGETFGLACAEFAFLGRPVLTYAKSVEDAHIQILGDSSLPYATPEDLEQLLASFVPDRTRDYDVISERFSPIPVMDIFTETFLRPAGLAKPTALATQLVETREASYEVLVDDMLGAAVARDKTWEDHLTALFDRVIRPGDFAIDVGASFGYHTVSLAKRCGKSGCVLAFEPQREIFELLRRNCVRNGVTSARLHNLAVSNQEGSGFLQYPGHGQQRNWGDVFVAPQGSGDRTRVKTLDSVPIERQVRLIKIDVQGAEPLVLAGAAQLLERCRPLIVIELEEFCLKRFGFTSQTIVEALHKIGYHLFLIDAPYPADFLAVPIEDLEQFSAIAGEARQPLLRSNPLNRAFEHGVRERLCFPAIAH